MFQYGVSSGQFAKITNMSDDVDIFTSFLGLYF